jgi:hypothetical protein
MTILLSMMISFQIKAQVRLRAIVSPEVHDDQTVTFRMTAREADTVILLLPPAWDWLRHRRRIVFRQQESFRYA